MNVKSLVFVAAMVAGSFSMSANAGQVYNYGRSGFGVVPAPSGPGILDKWFPAKKNVPVTCEVGKGIGVCAGQACCASVPTVSAGKGQNAPKVQFCKSKCPMVAADKKACCKDKLNSR